MATHSISMQGVGASCLSAKKGSAATAGYPCHFTANDTVADSANGAVFSGVIAGVRDELVTVQYRGFVTLPYTGTAPAVGYATLAANGAGGVKTASGGRSLLVVSVDPTAATVCVLL